MTNNIDCKKQPYHFQCVTKAKGEIPLPSTKDLVDFLNGNNCAVASNAPLWDLLLKVDDCRLWGKVWDALDKTGFPRIFDPQLMPDGIKAGLKRVGGRNPSCQEAADIVSAKYSSTDPLACLTKRGTDESVEMTGLESFLACVQGEVPGTCSEVAYRKASAILYLNPTCDIRVAYWKNHVEVFIEGAQNNDLRDMIIWLGDPVWTGSASSLFLGYFWSTFDPKAVELSTRMAPSGPPPLIHLHALYLIEKKEYQQAEAIASVLNETEQLKPYGYRIFLSCKMAQGDYKEAEKYAGLLAVYDPWDYFAYLGFADVLDKEGHGGALRLIKQAISLADPFEKENFSILIEYQKKLTEGITKIIKELQAFLEKNEGVMAEHYISLVLLYDALGEHQKVEALTRKGIEKFSEKIDIFAAVLNRALFKQGRQKEFIPICESLLKRYPDNFAVMEQLAPAYLYDGDFKKSELLFNKLAGSSDKMFRGVGFSGLGDVAGVRDRDYFKAMGYYEAALKEDDGSAYLYFGFADYVMSATGDKKKALELVTKGREIDPFDTSAYSILANISLDGLDLEESEKWATLSARLLGDDFNDYDTVGFVNMYLGDFPLASGCFAKVLEKDPKDFNALTAMTEMHFESGNADYKNYLQGVLNDPQAAKDEQLYWMLGRMAEHKGDKEKAKYYYQISSSIMPGNGETLRRLANLGGSPACIQLTDEIQLGAILDAENWLKG